MLAFGGVLFTAGAVAAPAHYLLDFGRATGFVLGAIIAPPDVVRCSQSRRFALPRRLVVVLEGEGLANDATALILYRFAVAAVATGVFSLEKAGGTFGLIVVGEIIWGIGAGWLSLNLRKWAHDPRVEGSSGRTANYSRLERRPAALSGQWSLLRRKEKSLARAWWHLRNCHAPSRIRGFRPHRSQTNYNSPQPGL